MKTNYKKILFLIVVVMLLFVVTSCDAFNNLLENIGQTTESKIELVTLKFDYQNNNEIIEIKLKKGERMLEPINPYIKGYDFLGWYKDLEDEKPFKFTQAITQNTTLFAKYELADEEKPLFDEVLVTFDYNIKAYNNVTIKINEGEKTIEPITPNRVGYKFLGWYLNLSDTSSYDFSKPVNKDLGLIAKWEETEITPEAPEEVKITFVFDNNSVSPIEFKIVKGNKIIEPKAPTKEGFYFVGWYNDLSNSKSFNFQSNLIEDTTLYAKWEDENEQPDQPDPTNNDVIITFNYSMPSVLDVSIKVEKGNTIIEPRPLDNEGWDFIGWFVNITDSEPFDFTKPVNNDLGLIAKWQVTYPVINYYEVIFIDDNEEINIVAVEVIEDDLVKALNLNPRDYYNFLGWYDQDTNEKFDFNTPITKDYILVSKWELKGEKAKVTFIYGSETKVVLVDLGAQVEAPKIEPTDDYEIVGWKTIDGEFFNFNQLIYEDLELRAYIHQSLHDRYNYLAQNVVKSNVKITKTLYQGTNFFGFTDPIGNPSIGTGVIIKQDGNDYYVLTNAHVVSRAYIGTDGEYHETLYYEFIISDYLDYEYEGKVVFDGVTFVDEDVDLAILKFTDDYGYSDLKPMPISQTTDYGDLLYLIGNPGGQKNAITVGYFLGEKNIRINVNGQQKQFRGNQIGAPGAGGSSGSMVIDYKNEIVGIIFAGQQNVGFENAKYMYAVPLDLIHYFLEDFYNYFNNKVFNILNNQIFNYQIQA